jgi:hypothetical protein
VSSRELNYARLRLGSTNNILTHVTEEEKVAEIEAISQEIISDDDSSLSSEGNSDTDTVE